MKCSKCGAENQKGKFCEECGQEFDNYRSESSNSENPDLENQAELSIDEILADIVGSDNANGGDSPEVENPDISDSETDSSAADDSQFDENLDEEKSSDVKDALDNLEKYEQGTIPEPKEKSKKKKNFIYPQNPMLWSFLWLLAFGAVLGILSAIFFNTDLEGKETVFGIVFTIFAAAVLGIDFAYYFPSALQLDRLLKGKGVQLEYHLKNYELIDLAEKAKKRNRGFYLAIGLFGLAFTVYYIYILATTVQQTTLMWVSLIFSVSVFVICGALFFVMPKFNYGKMMENGSRVIIGSKSVYYGGTYYHWRKVQPDATFGKMNTKKHELTITFTQEFKNGSTKKQKVEMYAPDTALRGVTKLLEEYEVRNKRYRERKEHMSVIDEAPVDK